MNTARVTLAVHVAWWVHWYIAALRTFAFLIGMEPDTERVVATCMRGVKVVVKCPHTANQGHLHERVVDLHRHP